VASENVHEGHRRRLRERALREGLDAFDPHQVIELLLFYALPRKDTSELAHVLIERFGTVLNVLTAPVEELTQIRGIGKRTAQWLNTLGELVESFAGLNDSDRVILRSCGDVLKFCEKAGKGIQRPQTFFIAMTSGGAVLVFDKMCDSTAWANAESLKRCLKAMLLLCAKNLIIAEFTEQAEPEIGADDRQYALSLAQTLETMDTGLLDVVLIGTERSTSMRLLGYLDGAQSQERSPLYERYLMEELEAECEGLSLEELIFGEE